MFLAENYSSRSQKTVKSTEKVRFLLFEPGFTPLLIRKGTIPKRQKKAWSVHFKTTHRSYPSDAGNFGNSHPKSEKRVKTAKNAVFGTVKGRFCKIAAKRVGDNYHKNLP